MNISKAIQRGDLEALRANEHEIIQDVNDMMEKSSIAWEDYITYWMAMHQDREIATQMFEVFLNTCKTALKPQKYDEVLSLYARPAMVGAVSTNNSEIIELVSDHLSAEDVYEEILSQYDKIPDWYSRTFS